jgi:hypothetical protein
VKKDGIIDKMSKITTNMSKKTLNTVFQKFKGKNEDEIDKKSTSSK